MANDPNPPDRSSTPDGSRWHRLPTEARHPASGELDRMSGEAIVALLLDEDRRGLEAARRSSGEIARAAECPPTFGSDPERIRAVIAGGPEAVFAAREGAEDRADEGSRAAAELAEGDLLIGISASSVTPFVRGALAAARERGARTVLLTCSAAGPRGEEPGGSPEAADPETADLVLALDTGPEVLTGSTRLKAGSATKAVLNAITTAAMVRLGKVYENLMVDLRPGSAKLTDRALRIIQAAGGVDRAAAEELHRSAGGEVKTAIVMARRGVGAAAARQRLAEAAGHVRRAIEPGRGDLDPPTERPVG